MLPGARLQVGVLIVQNVGMKVSFGRTMMQALELLRLAKRHISGQSNIEQ